MCTASILSFLIVFVVIAAIIVTWYGWRNLRQSPEDSIDSKETHSRAQILLSLGVILFIVAGALLVRMNADGRPLTFSCGEDEAVCTSDCVRVADDITVAGHYFAYNDPINNKVFYEGPVHTGEQCQRLLDSEIAARGVTISVPCFEVIRLDDKHIRISGLGGGVVGLSLPIYPHSGTESSVNDATALPGGVPVRVSKGDIQAPMIQVVGQETVYVKIGDDYFDLGAIATDDIDGNITKHVEVGGTPIDTSRAGVHTITYTVVDTSGNKSFSSRNVIVVAEEVYNEKSVVLKGTPDTEPPKILLSGGRIVKVKLGDTYNDRGAIATDAVDGDISNKVVVRGLPIDTSKEGVHSIYYSVTDTAGNTASTLRTVSVTHSVLSSDDAAFITSCILGLLDVGCERADVDKNGSVNDRDLNLFINRANAIDVNRNTIVEAEGGAIARGCFFKVETSNGYECARDQYGELIVSADYFSQDFSVAFTESAHLENPQNVVLADLKDMLGETVMDTIAYASVAQYDLDNDGFVNISLQGSESSDVAIIRSCINQASVGVCAHTDINRDGVTTSQDVLYLSYLRNENLYGSYSISDIEDFTFDHAIHSDVSILEHCIEQKYDRGSCIFADLDGNNTINSKDRTLFDQEITALDVNQDGKVSGMDSVLPVGTFLQAI